MKDYYINVIIYYEKIQNVIINYFINVIIYYD